MARGAFLNRIRSSGYLLPAALTGYLWLKGGWPGLPGLACPLRALTGIPCPTCFLTRATCASLHADWPAALQLHAFGPVVAAALVLWSVQAIRSRRFYPQGVEASAMAWASRRSPAGKPQARSAADQVSTPWR